ncbi:FERM RhoGEF and pleckstrin domain-containing protein 1 [Fasciolopsis buskii]|uniref:FERM RhoGEF and pleckstrin domain-containing protein 1 n=1 Tax=Fasciolopsis buskii TaxID=27845 RepID=A0A8E0RXT0_9TREM|nr:FERM RhoGEF and pleckstrin domain-containing protein 1 [Fasciolopsis buski]
MFGFLGLLPLSPVQSTPVGTTGETDLPVPRRTAPPSPSHSKSNDLTVWPSISNSIAFRSHLRRMPNLNRIGWLKKYSRRGFQPRMVFLFDDRIVFTSRIRGSQLFLKIHGIISLNCAYVAKEHLNIPSSDQTAVNTDDTALFAVVAVVDIIPTVNVDEASAATQRSKCSYSTHSRSRSTAAAPRDPLRSRSRSKSCARHKLRRKLLFCAPDEASRNAWVADINRLIGRSVETGESEAAGCDVTAGQLEFKLPPGVFRFRDPDLSEWVRNELVQHQPGTHPSSRVGSSLSVRAVQSRKTPPEEIPGCLTDALLTVCWHRHLGITHTQLLNANDCEVSSFLLRKFKHGSGWQKLWAVLSDLSLLFYKSPEDLHPLARLALLGYTVELVDSTQPPPPPVPQSSVSVPISTVSGKRSGSGKLSHSVIQLSHGSKQYQLRAETQEILMRCAILTVCRNSKNIF